MDALTCAEQSYFNSAISFFNTTEKWNQVLPLLRKTKKEAPITLRKIEYFVMFYARDNNIIYKIANTKKSPKNNNDFIIFNVARDYDCQISNNSKQFFDPFRRGSKKIMLKIGNDEIITTIGQLNYMKWLIENCILDYILDHKDDIFAEK